jgi:hypothetical protein
MSSTPPLAPVASAAPVGVSDGAAAPAPPPDESPPID